MSKREKIIKAFNIPLLESEVKRIAVNLPEPLREKVLEVIKGGIFTEILVDGVINDVNEEDLDFVIAFREDPRFIRYFQLHGELTAKSKKAIDKWKENIDIEIAKMLAKKNGDDPNKIVHAVMIKDPNDLESTINEIVEKTKGNSKEVSPGVYRMKMHKCGLNPLTEDKQGCSCVEVDVKVEELRDKLRSALKEGIEAIKKSKDRDHGTCMCGECDKNVGPLGR